MRINRIHGGDKMKLIIPNQLGSSEEIEERVSELESQGFNCEVIVNSRNTVIIYNGR
jgi:hypothetical protein